MIDEKKLILHLNDWMLQESFLRHMKNPADTILNVIKAVEEQPKIGSWIPCSERFPEREGNGYPHVIAFSNEIDGWNMYIAVYDIWKDKKWRMAHGPMEEITDVVAGQPLPEAYHG